MENTPRSDEEGKCSCCGENKDIGRCHCGHLACQEHTYFHRQGNRLIPMCIDCYEKARSDLAET